MPWIIKKRDERRFPEALWLHNDLFTVGQARTLATGLSISDRIILQHEWGQKYVPTNTQT